MYGHKRHEWDDLRTPVQMYDEGGEKTRECELDVYRKVRNFTGSSTGDCPFRYQGQYEDSETGLYYNRFRYYDPSTGNYLSQDPIGLQGGNPTLYGYVKDVNSWLDVFGLELVRVYLYTSSEGYKGITGTGTIRANDPSARGIGAISKPTGVYVTTIPPERPIEAASYNRRC